jgi:hypothetical protein
MRCFATRTWLAVVATVVTMLANVPAAHAQYIEIYQPRVLVAPPPVISFYPPSTAYYAPAPAVTYSYYPPTTVYAPPAVAVAPVITTPGYYTTRSYVGFGIFRPRGVYTQSYYTPPASYYGPVIVR